MSYNAKVIREQGASVLRVASGGSILVEAGGTILGAGTIQNTGAVTYTGGVTAASVTVSVGGPLFLGNVQFISAASNSGPAGLPVSASPGSIFFRSDGSASNMYVNVSTGTAGSVWTATCVNAP